MKGYIDYFSGTSSRICIYSFADDYSEENISNPMVPEQYKKVYSAPVYIRKYVLIGSTSVVLPG